MTPLIEVPPAPDYALKIRHTYKAGWEQWYFLTGDCHWDSPECYIRLLHRHLKEAREHVKRQQHSGAWLSLVEIEALLSLIPDMSPDIPQTARRD